MAGKIALTPASIDALQKGLLADLLTPGLAIEVLDSGKKRWRYPPRASLRIRERSEFEASPRSRAILSAPWPIVCHGGRGTFCPVSRIGVSNSSLGGSV